MNPISQDTPTPNYEITQKAIASFRRDKERLFIAPQNLIELWNVVTRLNKDIKKGEEVTLFCLWSGFPPYLLEE